MNLEIANDWSNHFGNPLEKLLLYKSECSRLARMRILKEQQNSTPQTIFELSHCREQIDHARRATRVAMSYWFCGAQGVVNKFFSIQYDAQGKCTSEDIDSQMYRPNALVHLTKEPVQLLDGMRHWPKLAANE